MSRVASSSRSDESCFLMCSLMLLAGFGVDVVVLISNGIALPVLSAAISLNDFGLKFSKINFLVTPSLFKLVYSPLAVSLVYSSDFSSAPVLFSFSGDCVCLER